MICLPLRRGDDDCFLFVSFKSVGDGWEGAEI